MARSNTSSYEKSKDQRSLTGGGRTTTTITSPEPVKPRHHFGVLQVPARHHGSYSQRLHSPPQRPVLGGRQDSVQTRYMGMLLALDTIPRFHNILSSFFTWILLAGFIIFPGAYTSLSTLTASTTSDAGSEAATIIIHSVKHISLLVVACVCSSIGALGMIYLWYLHAQNYVWLLQRIFLPGCLNSLAGFISTLINIYGSQDGTWNITARVTESVIGGCMVVTGGLFAVYNFWFLRNVKKMHEKEMGQFNVVKEGWKDKIEKKAHQPAFGGVV